MQAEITRTSVEFEKKKKEAEQARSLKVECDQLREQVQELQRDNSAQQAKMLMSAFGNMDGSSAGSGLGSLLGSSSGSSMVQNEGSSGQADRVTQLEREVSTLTNQNLKLQELNAELQQKLNVQISL